MHNKKGEYQKSIENYKLAVEILPKDTSTIPQRLKYLF
jgi:hypothetical protein